MLDQSVLVHAIPNLEAKASSAIENINTPNDALFREASLGDHAATPASKEAARYRNALNAAVGALKRVSISTRMAIDVCRMITDSDLDSHRTAGTKRANIHTSELIYTPPEGETRLRELLANWEAFAHERGDIDPLVRPHVVIEQIFKHPFRRIGNLVLRQGIAGQAASKDHKELGKLGVLAKEKIGRDKIFHHRKYLDVLFSDGHHCKPYWRTGQESAVTK